VERHGEGFGSTVTATVEATTLDDAREDVEALRPDRRPLADEVRAIQPVEK
jgi:hypothetical protein